MSTPRRAASMSCLVLLITCLAPNASAQANLSGTYKDDKLTVVLKGSPASGYTGTIEMGGRTFPLNADGAGTILTGKFSQGAAAYPFTASLSGGTLSFKTGTTTYQLQREGGAPDAVAALANVAPADPAAAGPPADRPIDAHKVEQAIRKGVEFLKGKQKNGHWDLPARGKEPRANARGEISIMDIQNSSQWGGLSALVTYAMLAAGEKDSDASVAAALTWLKTADLTGTYSVATRALVWNALPSSQKKPYLEFAKKDRDTLLKNKRSEKGMEGMFRYTAYDLTYDHSASQFGVLGLWACEQVGAEVPAAFWKEAQAAWIAHQEGSGAWNYGNMFTPRPAPTPAMTAAGVASLFVLGDMLNANAGINCAGNVPHKQIDLGIKWINEHYDQVFSSSWPFYSAYGIERIGLASGYKYLGNTDWYRHGALRLIGSQQPDGSWGEGVSDTCFAILFLARGRAPVVMNKLQYAIDNNGDRREANWNQRPRDAANFTRWLGRQLERDLNWQIVNLDRPVEDLHDAPILYIAGNQGLSFTPAQEAKLKQFVEQGGLILGHADCADARFVSAFKKLGGKLFPYEFRELPAGHPIYTELFDKKNWKMPLPIQGLSNGARELMLLLPAADPARFWQTGAYLGREPTHQLMANVFMYVSERRDLRFKGDSWLVWPNPDAPAAARAVKVARLEYAGPWDPEPAGWRRLAMTLRNSGDVNLTVEAVKLGDGKLSATEHKLTHLTGTVKMKLTAAQQAELKAYVGGGGTLLIDACGGAGEAATSLEAEIAAIAPGKPQVLKPDDAVFANLGVPATEIAFRPFAARQLGAAKGPRLKAVTVNNRPAILYSSEDLSVGLVGQPIDGIVGYTPASATAIVRSVVIGLK